MKCYDNGKERKYIMYLDANNLYGYAISQYFPYNEFKWFKKDINRFDVYSIGKYSSISYILEVDLEYPSKLHKVHKDYPLAPAKVKISQDMLSKYCCNIADEYGIKIGGIRNKTKIIKIKLFIYK